MKTVANGVLVLCEAYYYNGLWVRRGSSIQVGKHLKVEHVVGLAANLDGQLMLTVWTASPVGDVHHTPHSRLGALDPDGDTVTDEVAAAGAVQCAKEFNALTATASPKPVAPKPVTPKPATKKEALKRKATVSDAPLDFEVQSTSRSTRSARRKQRQMRTRWLHCALRSRDSRRKETWLWPNRFCTPPATMPMHAPTLCLLCALLILTRKTTTPRTDVCGMLPVWQIRLEAKCAKLSLSLSWAWRKGVPKSN